jgi:tRNA U55 pseudouridine synthase TruB
MICIYDKHVGETMSEVISRFSKENNIKEKIAYAGRLDPLAYGKIIILTGNDIYKKDDYCNKCKIYETWIIDGITTDTYDIMGLITSICSSSSTTSINEGNYKQYYPPYSSIPIRIGNIRKPLWYYTKNNIEIPDELKPYKYVTLYNATKLDEKYISSNELLDIILDRIKKVITGDFRQNDIIEQWTHYLQNKSDDNYKHDNYKISKWRFEISSGGYIRYIANMTGSTCYDINRITYL